MRRTEHPMRTLLALVLTVMVSGAIGCQSHLAMQAMSIGTGIAPQLAPVSFGAVTEGVQGIVAPITASR